MLPGGPRELLDLCGWRAFCGGVPLGLGPGRAVRARVCALVCVRVRGGSPWNWPVTPRQNPPATPTPEPHLERVCDPRRGGEGTAPLKGSPPSGVMDTSASAPRPPERGRELVFIHNFFLFLPLRQLFIQRWALGAQRARSPAAPAPRAPALRQAALPSQVHTDAVPPSVRRACSGGPLSLGAASVGTQTGFGGSTAILRM